VTPVSATCACGAEGRRACTGCFRQLSPQWDSAVALPLAPPRALLQLARSRDSDSLVSAPSEAAILSALPQPPLSVGGTAAAAAKVPAPLAALAFLSPVGSPASFAVAQTPHEALQQCIVSFTANAIAGSAASVSALFRDAVRAQASGTLDDLWAFIPKALELKFWDAGSVIEQLDRFSVYQFPHTLSMLADVAAVALGLPSDDASFAVAHLLACLAEGLLLEATTAGASLASALLAGCPVRAGQTYVIRAAAQGLFFADEVSADLVDHTLACWSEAMSSQRIFPTTDTLTGVGGGGSQSLSSALAGSSRELNAALKEVCRTALRVGVWASLQRLVPEAVSDPLVARQTLLDMALGAPVPREPRLHFAFGPSVRPLPQPLPVYDGRFHRNVWGSQGWWASS